MSTKGIAVAIFVSFMFGVGYAADIDNAISLPGSEKPSLSGNASFFQGVWNGKWAWGVDGVELTITIGEKNKDGLFKTNYTWGFGQLRKGRPIQPGSINVLGREQGEIFILEWKDKEGTKTGITLTKIKDNTVKATFEKEGTTAARYGSDHETNLTRR